MKKVVWSIALITIVGMTSGCVDGTVDDPAAAQAATTPSGIEPTSGIAKDALVGVMSMPDLGNELLYVVIYLPNKADKNQLAAAPVRLCSSRSRTVTSVEDKLPEHPSELPGARKLVVRCK